MRTPIVGLADGSIRGQSCRGIRPAFRLHKDIVPLKEDPRPFLHEALAYFTQAIEAFPTGGFGGMASGGGFGTFGSSQSPSNSFGSKPQTGGSLWQMRR